MSLPVAIIGAGPIGLAAAAHLDRYQQSFIVLEAGAGPGATVAEWRHVRMFSPWRYNVDRVARELLESNGWTAPDPAALPTGGDVVDRYLAPLAAHPSLAPYIRFNARVTAVGRKDFDKVRSSGREQRPFEIRLASGETVEARAVIDASGTWNRPNPAASGGVAVSGEREIFDRIAYGIPDVLGRERAAYAGKRILVVGSGHSAFNVVLDLLALSAREPGTDIVWVMRRENLEAVWGGGSADALEARGELGQRAKRAVEAGLLRVLTPYRIRSISRSATGLVVNGVLDSEERPVAVDRMVVCTGFRPDLEMLQEVRLSTDAWLESSAALGPLIDPNLHSCGTVRPHGARELAHPEKDFFILGVKSYGRAPTFLLATGYEQARSVVAQLAGDIAAAERVELELPETGVCSVTNLVGGGAGCCGEPQQVAVVAGAAVAESVAAAEGSGCCGGPAPAGVNACCVDDADAKAAGQSGCGCGSSEPVLISIETRSKPLTRGAR
jgi:thioredoxin reductase